MNAWARSSRQNKRETLACGSEECIRFPNWCRHCREEDNKFDNMHLANPSCVAQKFFFQENRKGSERWLYRAQYQVTLLSEYEDFYYGDMQERNKEAVFSLEKEMLRRVLNRFLWESNCEDELFFNTSTDIAVQESRAPEFIRFLSGGSYDPLDNITDSSCIKDSVDDTYNVNSICIQVDGAFTIHVNSTISNREKDFIQRNVRPQIDEFLRLSMEAGAYNMAHYDIIKVSFGQSQMDTRLAKDNTGNPSASNIVSPEDQPANNQLRKTINASVLSALAILLIAFVGVKGLRRWRRHVRMRSIRHLESTDDALREDEDVEVA